MQAKETLLVINFVIYFNHCLDIVLLVLLSILCLLVCLNFGDVGKDSAIAPLLFTPFQQNMKSVQFFKLSLCTGTLKLFSRNEFTTMFINYVLQKLSIYFPVLL